MNGQKYISIIVAVYNIEKYIQKCVESLIEQDCNPSYYEIILVDDGSADRSGELCDAYQKRNSNIRVIHKKNGGLSDARNVGLENAEGRYILFVDGDDYIQKNILGSLIKSCKEQNEPQVMFLNAVKCYPDNRIQPYDTPMCIEKLKGEKQDVLAYLSERKMYPASAWSKMISHDFLIQNNISFKVNQLSEDYEWSFSIYKLNPTYGYCLEQYYFYRQDRQGSITSRMKEAHFLDLMQIIDNFEMAANSQGETEKNKESILRFAAYVYRCMIWKAAPYYAKYKNKINQKAYLLDYRNSKDFKMIRGFSKVVGIGNTIRLLNIYRRIRR